jgi:hypothetical protein
MRKFMEEAGFIDLSMDDSNPQLVVAVGHKPPSDAPVVAPPHSTAPSPAPLEQPVAAPVVPDPVIPEPAVTEADASAYIQFLETEVARKNAALADLVARLKRRERELIAARQPRLPWKRRKGQR